MTAPTPIMVDLTRLYAECQDAADRLTLLKLAKLHFIKAEEFAQAAKMREIERRIEQFITDYKDFAKDPFTTEAF